MNQKLLLALILTLLSLDLLAQSSSYVSFTPNALRNDWQGVVGCKFTVASKVVVSGLGVYNPVTTNTQSHPVGIWDMNSNLVCSTTVSLSGAPVGFKNVALRTNVTLLPGTYYRGALVYTNGDTWSDLTSAFSEQGGFATVGAIYGNGGFTYPTHNGGSGGNTYLGISVVYAPFYVAAVTNTVACDYVSISNALMTANEGDVVLIQPGSCQISNTIYIDRHVSFTIRGSGTNATTLISPAAQDCIELDSQSSNVFTFSDLNCVGDAANSQGFFAAWSRPVHFYNIQMTNILYRGINFYQGLVDHCTFIQQQGNPQPISFLGYGYANWTNTANPLGTTNAGYVEDCYFDARNSANSSSGNGNGFFDAYNGAQLVFRHNYCVGNAPTGGHGYDSQPTSARTWEVYDNIFTNMTTGGEVLQWRGGTGVVFSNQVYGSGGITFCQLIYYRSCAVNHAMAVGNYGIPGQGLRLYFYVNPTDGQQQNIGNTTYVFVSAYRSSSNWQGLNGYGGGNVLIGATLAQTMTNLYNCINQGTGMGTSYSTTLSVDSGHTSGCGHDFLAVGVTANSLILTNALDGNTDQFGYPANQQQGVLVSYPLNATNFVNHQVLLPAYSWGNRLNGSVVGMGVDDNTAECSYYITNLVKLGRDYFNDTVAPNYTPLVYPHPLQALEVGSGSGSAAPPPTPLPPPGDLKVAPRI